MTENRIKLLDIAFANNTFKDFYVRSIKLDEGISRTYKAELTILTTTPYSLNEVSNLINQQALVTITQHMDTDDSCTRYLSGVVTSVVDKGVIYASKNAKHAKNCMCYELTIEPPLVHMRMNKNNRVFNDTFVHEVINEIGKGYGINFKKEFDDTLLYETSKSVTFHQQEESDFDFITRLLFAYGLNYYFVHKNKQYSPDVYLTDGQNFKPVSELKCSEGFRVDKTILCDIRNTDDNSYLLENWQVNVRMLSNDITKIADSVAGMFEYSNDFSKGSEIIAKSIVSRNIRDAVKRTKSSWSADCDSLILCVGSSLKVGGISLNKDESYTCMLLSGTLDYKAAWPSNMAIPSDEVRAEDSLENKISGYIPLRSGASGSLISHERFFTNEGRSHSSWNTQQSHSNTVVKATVCDKSGFTKKEMTIDFKDTYANPPMTFYALLEGMLPSTDAQKTIPVHATIVAPIGGLKCGLYHIPHIGDEVFLTLSGGKYYLLGYSTQETEIMDFAAQFKNNLIHATTLKHGTASGDSKHEIRMAESEQNINDTIASMIMNGMIDNYLTGLARQTLDTRIYFKLLERYNPKDGKTSLKKRCVAIRDNMMKKYSELLKCKASHENECVKFKNIMLGEDEPNLQTRTKALEEIKKSQTEFTQAVNHMNQEWDNLSGLVKEIINIAPLSKYPNGKTSHMDVSTTGILNLLSKNNVNVNSGLYTNVVSDKDISITSNNGSVSITAPKKISLTVGDNSIEIDRYGITLLSRRWSSGTHPLDALLLLDSTQGAILKGPTTSVSSFLNTKISDALGGSVNIKGGSVSVSGNSVSIDTCSGKRAKIRAGMALTKIFTSIKPLLTTTTGMSNDIYNQGKVITDTLTSLPEMGMDAWGKYLGSDNEPSNFTWYDIVVDVINLVCLVLDAVTLCAEKIKADWLDEMLPGDVTKRDAMRLATLAGKGAVILIGMAGVIAKMKQNHGSSMSITDSIKIETNVHEEVASEYTVYSSPIAGIKITIKENSNDQKQPEKNIIERDSNASSL